MHCLRIKGLRSKQEDVNYSVSMHEKKTKLNIVFEVISGKFTPPYRTASNTTTHNCLKINSLRFIAGLVVFIFGLSKTVV